MNTYVYSCQAINHIETRQLFLSIRIERSRVKRIKVALSALTKAKLCSLISHSIIYDDGL